MNYEYDVKKIETVLEDFYKIAKFKTVLYDSDFTPLSAFPLEECTFCKEMSKNPISLERCQECTRNSLLICQKELKPIIYNCHAGLVEAVAPILMDDIIVGYIMLGQVLKDNNNLSSIIEYSQKFIGTKAEDALNELTAKSEDEILAAVRMMQGCAYYLLLNKFIKEKHGNMLLEVKKYIEENPAADLSSNTLCKKFDISRTYLYKLSNTYFGMPIASFVRLKRLQYAERLIKEGCSVTMAAERAGFCDYGYFGKIFKRYIGKTPLKAKTK